MNEGSENQEIQKEPFNSSLRRVYDFIPITHVPERDVTSDNFDFSTEDAQNAKEMLRRKDSSELVEKGIAILQKELSKTKFTKSCQMMVINEYKEKFQSGYFDKEQIFAEPESTEYILELTNPESEGASDEAKSYEMEKTLLARALREVVDSQTKYTARTGEVEPIQIYYGVDLKKWSEEFGQRTPPGASS